MKFLTSYLFHRVIKGWEHSDAKKVAALEVRAYRKQRIERFGRI